MTSRDRALDVLSEFDRQVTIRRRELIEEFDLSDQEVKAADKERAENEEQLEALESSPETTTDELGQPKASA